MQIIWDKWSANLRLKSSQDDFTEVKYLFQLNQRSAYARTQHALTHKCAHIHSSYKESIRINRTWPHCMVLSVLCAIRTQNVFKMWEEQTDSVGKWNRTSTSDTRQRKKRLSDTLQCLTENSPSYLLQHLDTPIENLQDVEKTDDFEKAYSFKLFIEWKVYYSC